MESDANKPDVKTDTNYITKSLINVPVSLKYVIPFSSLCSIELGLSFL
jgi:hypothetical protein